MGADTKGTLARYPLPRLLCFLEQKSFTGVLRIQEDAMIREMLLSEGIPVALYPQSGPALTRQFLEWGRLDTEQYAVLMNSLTAADAQEEALLTEVANVTADELDKGRRYVLFRDLCRLFNIADAPFVLSATADERIGQHAHQAAIEPLYLVYNGIRNSYNEARLRKDLAGLAGLAFRLSGGSDELASRFGFGADEAPVLATLGQGYWTLDDLLTECAGDDLPTLMVVYSLWCAGGLETATANSVSLQQPTRRRPTKSSPLPGAAGTEADLVGEEKASGPVQLGRLRIGPKSEPPIVEQKAAAPPPEPPAVATPPPAPTPAPTPQPRRRPTMDTQRKLRTPTPRSGTFAAARVPDAILRKARLSSTRLKADGNLKPEAVEVLDELVDRLDAIDGQNPFEQLGLDLKAKAVDVKRSYMQLVKRLHPDRLTAIGLDEMAEPADALFKRITQAHQTLSDPGNLDEARRIFSGDATPEDPEEARRAIEAEVNFQKGEVFFRKGDLAQAEAYFRQAVEGNPAEGEHLAMLGWTIYQATPRDQRHTRRDDVQTMIIRALELSPRCARGHYFLGKLYLDNGKKEQAMSSFRQATNIRDNYIEALRELRLLTMRREREQAPKRKSTLLEIFSLKKRKGKKK